MFNKERRIIFFIVRPVVEVGNMEQRRSIVQVQQQLDIISLNYRFTARTEREIKLLGCTEFIRVQQTSSSIL